jgi:hypothetical protein
LGQTESILREMVRITKPGGTVIFDYGLEARQVTVEQQTITTSDADIPAILRAIGVRSWRSVPLDGFLVAVKRIRYAERVLSAIAAAPALRPPIHAIERLSLRFMRDRMLYIVEV